MPRSLCSAGRMRTSLSGSSSTSQHIWISDDLLADTFRNFTHRHRRYGSNVPGPLEARRRATKRKNTNLAHVDYGSSPHESAVVFGAGSQQGWWQKTQPTVTKPVPSLLPSWLFKPPDSPTSQLNRSPQDLENDDPDQSLIEQAELRTKEEFRQRIRQCSRMKSIRNLINSMQINLRQDPSLSEDVFGHILDMHWNDTTITGLTLHEVLTDPSLNPPGSKNHLILMQELYRKGVSRKTWDSIMFPAIQNALRLGLVGVEELQEMITLLPSLHKQCGIATMHDGEKVISDYHRLLTSLEDSQVLRLRDLEESFVQQWYTRIATGTPYDNAITLLWRLRSFSSKSDVEVVAELVTSKLQYLAQESLSATEKFKAWMTTLPQDLRGPAILHTSQSLVTSAISGKITMAEIERWYETFSSLNSEACAHVIIDENAWNQALAAHCELTPGQNILSLAWTVTYLVSNQQESSRLLSTFNFKEQFSDIFSTTQNVNDGDLLGKVVMTLDTLPLPAKENLYRHLQNFTNKSMMAMLGHRVHEDSLKLLLERDLTMLTDEKFYCWAKSSANDALTDLAHSATEDIDEFRVLAQTLIMKNKASFKIVNRILEHNMAIKLALPHWPGHVEFQKHEYNRRYDLDPARVTDLIHQLAISFAVSPVIGPRSAFRYVYHIYLYLHRYGAPIHPLMARALWHAGVTRYGKEGTPNTQLEWCLFKVREIEGQKTADMLLWSAGFRRLRGQEMEEYQLPTTQEPSLPSALRRGHEQRTRYLQTAKARSQKAKVHSRRHVRRQNPSLIPVRTNDEKITVRISL